MQYSRLNLTVITVVIAAALAGCGKSDDAKREDIVKCASFSMSLINMRPGSPLAVAADAAFTKIGITGSDTFTLSSAGQQYSKSMDPAKVTRLAQEGSSSAMKLIRNNDANGLASYLKDCVATYKDLGR